MGIAASRAAAVAFLIVALGLSFVAEAKPSHCNQRRKVGDCGITQPPANTAPTISGAPATSVNTGQTYSFTPTAADADGNALNFSIVNRPGWATFSSTTGRLSGTPTSSAVGEYIDIRISVSDGSAVVSLAPFSIVVNQSNRAPTLSGTPPTTGREGQAYMFTPTSADADGDTLTFSIANRPSWAAFSASTGRLSGTPPTGSVGTYSNISISVSDGSLTASLPAYSIAVQQVAVGSATVSWQPPTTRTDGTPLTNLAGYRVRYGTSPGSYPNTITLPNGGLTSAVIEDLPAATYYFVATAYDSTGAESAYSAAVSKMIQ